MLAITVHGEARHLSRHAQIAAAAGVGPQMVGGNGDLSVIASPEGAGRQAGYAPAGRLRR